MSPSELVNGRTYRIDRYSESDPIHGTGVFEGQANKDGYLFKLTNNRMVYIHIRHISDVVRKFETIEKIAKDYFGVVSLNAQSDMSRLLLKALSETYDEGRWQLQEELALEEDRVG